MKKFILNLFMLYACVQVHAQQVLHISKNAAITIQNGTELTLQGGLTIENGGSILNDGTIRLKNNVILNGSDWIDNSIAGALNGTGNVIFNSTQLHNFSGSSEFFRVEMNAGGLNLNNQIIIHNQLHLVNGKITTGNSLVFLNNSDAFSLLNDPSNTGYVNSWVNGKFRRLIATNTDGYDFPVGNTTRCNLLQFLNNNIQGTAFLTASFGDKPGTDAGLNVSEGGQAYVAVNVGGVWYLVPDAQPTGGNYALQLYFNGFNGLLQNQFGILRRPDASTNAADWTVPPGSALEPYNGTGRKVSDGFARRILISDFSQLGIGMLGSVPCENCVPACTYSQGFYGNQKGFACYLDGAVYTSINSSQLMQNAFGPLSSKIFGNVGNRRFFTLFKSDITGSNIYKMLPGTGGSQPIAVDPVSPYDGAYFADPATWPLVPMVNNGSQKGTINNQLLSQLMSLWFNLRTSNSLGTISLVNDTLVTTAQTSCGSGVPTGDPQKFGLPHSIILYLNGGNGYLPNVNGLYELANDVLGGANNDVSPAEVQSAMARINLAFEGCRILTETLAYVPADVLLTKNTAVASNTPLANLLVMAFPNPYDTRFNLRIMAPVSGMALIEFFESNGKKIFQLQRPVTAGQAEIVPYSGPYHRGGLIYRVTIGGYKNSGTVIGIR